MPTTGRSTIGNLPAETTSFVGRERELDEVKRLLSVARLVTLAGIGGAGKTRLALRAAADLRRAFPDGVWSADLTELRDSMPPTQEVQEPDVLAFLVAAAPGLRDQPGKSPMQVLGDQLVDRHMLLVLDNCEHLLPVSAVLAEALLRACPRLRILATSREPLSLPGEVIFAVPPLRAPQPGDGSGLAKLRRYESVALFLARAEAVNPDFSFREDNHVVVVDLCRRLDGLPLAIELAAAQTPVLTPAQILERLTDRFTVLDCGARTAPERQQTLRSCVDWSFHLCTKPERILWARLSVFAGGFELDAVEGICADDQLPEADLLDLLASLIDKSILVRDDGRDGQAETARYRMLETIRDYGQDRLRNASRDTGEEAVLRHRHRDWHEQLVARARAEWISDRQAYWMARLTREHPNLRAAMEFCLTEPGEAQAVLRIEVSLPGSYWSARGLFGEARRWLDRALAQTTAATPLRARAMLVGSFLATLQGDPPPAIRLLNEGEDLARQLDVTAALAHAAYLRGVAALVTNNLPVAVETIKEAWTILSRTPEQDRDLDLYLTVLTTFGGAAAMAGDPELASARVQELLAIVEPRGETFHRSYGLFVNGLIAWIRGDFRLAAAQEMESLRLKQTWGSDDRYGVTLTLEVLAWITADLRQHRRAATLLGAADALWTDSGTPIAAFGHFLGHHHVCKRQTRDALGEAAFANAFHNGQTLTYEDALANAIGEPQEPRPTPSDDAPTALTRRQRQVADLIAEGLSNKDIAAKLVISQRTAESHVEHILMKLGFTSRVQVAAWKASQQSRDQDS